eukprot:COSAG02_NODE_842_length_16609_cov_117.586675_2_plen_69_part_00
MAGWSAGWLAPLKVFVRLRGWALARARGACLLHLWRQHTSDAWFLGAVEGLKALILDGDNAGNRGPSS